MSGGKKIKTLESAVEEEFGLPIGSVEREKPPMDPPALPKTKKAGKSGKKAPPTGSHIWALFEISDLPITGIEHVHLMTPHITSGPIEIFTERILEGKSSNPLPAFLKVQKDPKKSHAALREDFFEKITQDIGESEDQKNVIIVKAGESINAAKWSKHLGNREPAFFFKAQGGQKGKINILDRDEHMSQLFIQRDDPTNPIPNLIPPRLLEGVPEIQAKVDVLPPTTSSETGATTTSTAASIESIAVGTGSGAGGGTGAGDGGSDTSLVKGGPFQPDANNPANEASGAQNEMAALKFKKAIFINMYDLLYKDTFLPSQVLPPATLGQQLFGIG